MVHNFSCLFWSLASFETWLSIHLRKSFLFSEKWLRGKWGNFVCVSAALKTLYLTLWTQVVHARTYRVPTRLSGENGIWIGGWRKRLSIASCFDLKTDRSRNSPLSPPLRNPTITGPIGANCVTDSCGVERWESDVCTGNLLTLGLWCETYVVVGCRWGVGVWCWRGVELICGKMYRFKVCDSVGTTEFNELSPLAILHFTLGVWCSLMWCCG